MAQERQCAAGRQPLLPLKECLCLVLTRGPQLLGQSLGLAQKKHATKEQNKKNYSTESECPRMLPRMCRGDGATERQPSFLKPRRSRMEA